MEMQPRDSIEYIPIAVMLEFEMIEECDRGGRMRRSSERRGVTYFTAIGITVAFSRGGMIDSRCRGIGSLPSGILSIKLEYDILDVR